MLRMAIVGLGWWGKVIVERMAGSTKVKIVSAVELDRAPHESFLKKFDLNFVTFDDALRDSSIDAIILATPHLYHAKQIIAAAAAGKHVFCENPLALNLQDAERCVEACRRAGVQLGIGHERRFEPAFLKLRNLVSAGELGTILHAEGNFSHDKFTGFAASNWRLDKAQAPAAGMTGMGIHLTDAFLALFGAVDHLYASTASRVIKSEAGDVVSVLFQFASGSTGYLNVLMATPLYLRLIVFGSEGWAEMRNLTNMDTPGPTTLTLQRKSAAAEVVTFDWIDTVRANIEAFADAIEGGATYPFTNEQLVGNIAILDAIIRSSETGQPVHLAPVRSTG